MKTYILRRIGPGWFEDVATVMELDPPIAMDLGNGNMEPATIRAEFPNASVIWARDRASFMRCVPQGGGALVMLDADQYEAAPSHGRCYVKNLPKPTAEDDGADA